MGDYYKSYRDRIAAALGGFQDKRAADVERESTSDTRAKRAPNYTTRYAIGWGRDQGWVLLDRERYDARLRRHHDLPLGADAMFESDDGVVFVQGAGRGERAPHWERFERAGGAERARKIHARFYYLEFKRDSRVPLVVERWA